MKLPYKILIQGYFTETELVVDWTPEVMKRNPETECLIEETWSAREADARRRNQLLFPGRLCRLIGWRESGGTLSISFGPTDYKELVGTNLCNPGIAERFGREYLSNGTAVCSVVITADHKLIVQQRSDHVYEHPSRFHICGGHLEPNDCAPANRQGPFSRMQKELVEELLVEPEWIADMYCLGLVRDSRTLKPEIIFETLLDVPAHCIAQGKGPEHKRLLFPNESPSELLEFLTSNVSRFVPVGLACLVTYGKRKYGEQWHRAFLAGLGNQERGQELHTSKGGSD